MENMCDPDTTPADLDQEAQCQKSCRAVSPRASRHHGSVDCFPMTPAERRLVDAVAVADLTADVDVDFNVGQPQEEKDAWASLLSGKLTYEDYVELGRQYMARQPGASRPRPEAPSGGGHSREARHTATP